MTYPDVQLYIDGAWQEATDGGRRPVHNPATGAAIGSHAVATPADLERAVSAAARAFDGFRRLSALQRSSILRRTSDLLRARVDSIAPHITLEQGKPIAQARAEVGVAADVLEWFAEEGRRVYGRVIPPRAAGITQTVLREPVGPVAAFTPWNFPLSQAVRKVGAALATGCTMVLKPAEDTPAGPAALADILAEAGLPAGVLNIVYGVPADISGHLIAHPAIRKISFTGSVPVGKLLAAQAGAHMKRATMELGGHAPVIVCADADLDAAAELLAAAKFRNAGQVCVSPTRFLIEAPAFSGFLERFLHHAEAVRTGDGMAPDTTMGPLVNPGRVDALSALVDEARGHGARVHLGGGRIGNIGCFFAPTVLTGVPTTARIMNEEPFGPVALLSPFTALDDAIAEANRLPYGLAAYGFTRSLAQADRMAAALETGMLTLNHIGLALPEVPFGGVKESGYGSEGGSEALEGYLLTKFVTRTAAA